jgi:hypothetical protein
VKERWKPAAGWEGLYEVSNLGHVRSVARVVDSANRWGPCRRSVRGHAVKPVVGSHGYFQVVLSRNGKARPYYVHRLVGETFLGPLPPGQQTRHGPGGKLDNRLVNLSYGTRAENERDKIRDGTFRQGHVTGDLHHSSKLTTVIVAECRRRHAAGETQTALARQYGVSITAMHNAVHGYTWQ